MKLRKIESTHPRYELLWEALKPSLVEREHRDRCWADIGEKEYYYVHDEAARVENTSANAIVNGGKASGKGITMAALKGQFCY